MKPVPRLWALIDDRPGNISQVLGVAEKLGIPFETKTLAYSPLVWLPSLLHFGSLVSLAPEARAPFAPPWPDIVIAAGRRMMGAALHIKCQHPSARLVQIMWPGSLMAYHFDLIATPEHDRIQRTNVLSLPLSAHRLTHEGLAKERARWERSLAHLPSPKIAVLLGGAARRHRITQEHYRELGRKASQLAGAGSLLITTSRRTAPEDLEAVMETVTVPHAAYRYGEGENPYMGYLANADQVIVTGDSMSMCSEACFPGKPVYIYAPSGSISAKHRRMHERLFREGLAAPLTGLPMATRPSDLPLDSAALIAEEIRRRWDASIVNSALI